MVQSLAEIDERTQTEEELEQQVEPEQQEEPELTEQLEGQESSSDEEKESSSEEEKEKWIFVKAFETQQQLDQFIHAEDCWSHRTSYSTKVGKITLYRCNRVRRNNKTQCAAQIRTLKKEDVEPLSDSSDDDQSEHVGNVESDKNDGDNTTEKKTNENFVLYRKNEEHTCLTMPKNDRSNKLSSAVKDKIIKLRQDGNKPLNIRLKLRSDKSIPKNEQPTKKQIKSTIGSN